MEKGKWLVRAGALLILLGFVLPSLTVSCTYMPTASQNISLADMAGQLDQGVLYFVPFGAVLTLILAFIPIQSRAWIPYLFIGKAAGAGIGILAMVITWMSSLDNLNSSGFQVRPAYGMLFLLAGYIMVVVGLVFEVGEVNWADVRTMAVNLPINRQSGSPSRQAEYPPEKKYYEDVRKVESPLQVQPAVQAMATGLRAVLEITSGNLPRRTINVTHDKFTIGRGDINDLDLPSPQVSRQHAHLRYGEGAWFIQDQNSTAGTFVNGRQVPATRLNSGDQITIGDVTLTFWMQ